MKFLFCLFCMGVGVLGISSSQEVPNLAGTWALLQVISDHWEVPFLGERPRRIIQTAILHIEQDGTELQLFAAPICSMVFDNGTALVRTSVKKEFLEVIKLGPVPGKLLPTEEGYEFYVPLFIVLNGVMLTDPQTEPLPTSPDDPRVYDMDGDGKPGFTVRVSVFGLISGEAYVIQRFRQEYRGRVLGPALIRGVISWQDEQVTLGASASWLLISGKGCPDPNPENSFFVLRRIEENTDCMKIAELFEQALKK